MAKAAGLRLRVDVLACNGWHKKTPKRHENTKAAQPYPFGHSHTYPIDIQMPLPAAPYFNNIVYFNCGALVSATHTDALKTRINIASAATVFTLQKGAAFCMMAAPGDRGGSHGKASRTVPARQHRPTNTGEPAA
jgi:hypothetical protein